MLCDSPSVHRTPQSPSPATSYHSGRSRQRSHANALDRACATGQPLVSNPEGSGVVHLRHPFTKELDGDTGLVYMYQRWYSPETGMFMRRAPVKPQYEHAFSFASQRPTNRIDPDGRKDLDTAISDCKDKERNPCRGANPVPPGGDSCYSFVCCVMEEMYYPDQGPFPEPQPMPIGPPNAGGGKSDLGDIVCFGDTSTVSNCNPTSICAKAYGEPVEGPMPPHVGVIDSGGNFHECGDGFNDTPGGPPRPPVAVW
jgi:RHS repeat-associated protein